MEDNLKWSETRGLARKAYRKAMDASAWNHSKIIQSEIVGDRTMKIWRVKLAKVGIVCLAAHIFASHYGAHAQSQLPDNLLQGLAKVHREHYEAHPKGLPTVVEKRLLGASAAGDMGAVERLVDLGIDVNCRGIDGSTPLGFAVFRGDLSMADFLIRKGANPNGRGFSNLTPLIRAFYRGDLVMIDFLLRNGADAHLDDGEGTNALTPAAQLEDPIFTRILLQSGADPNMQNKSNCRDNVYCGYTPLHWASSKGNIRVIDLLLAAGARVDIGTPHGETPTSLAKDPAVKAILTKGSLK